MLILVTYDVNTTTKEGRGRLARVAKECTKYGQRVQNSVFECNIDNDHYVRLRAALLEIMDDKLDSIRFYKLGNNFTSRLEHYGKQNSFEPGSVLII